MVSGGVRPGWQREPCPPWCVVEHAEDDHPDDRRHVSAGIEVPVMALVGVLEGADGHRDRVEARRLVVCAQRRDGEPDTWLYVGDGTDQMVEVDVAGWTRLVSAVRQVLASVTGGDGERPA